LRGRLPAGVAVLTADGPGGAVGLTVASWLIVEGDPARVIAIIGRLTDLAEGVEHSKAFVVHVLEQGGQARSDVFAGIRPSPGGPFAGVEVEATPWGPRMADVATWAGCELADSRHVGYQTEIVGLVRAIALAESPRPLVWYRGRYRALAE
jgi:flavin reductase (DIM6/NTAB) family NADH-FMN oxidoreductase RutF